LEKNPFFIQIKPLRISSIRINGRKTIFEKAVKKKATSIIALKVKRRLKKMLINTLMIKRKEYPHQIYGKTLRLAGLSERIAL
jgi:hypothetical protein